MVNSSFLLLFLIVWDMVIFTVYVDAGKSKPSQTFWLLLIFRERLKGWENQV